MHEREAKHTKTCTSHPVTIAETPGKLDISKTRTRESNLRGKMQQELDF